MSEAEKILQKHLNPSILIRDNSEYTFQQIMEFAKEIVDITWDAATIYIHDKSSWGSIGQPTYEPDQKTFIKQLFQDK